MVSAYSYEKFITKPETCDWLWRLGSGSSFSVIVLLALTASECQ